MLIDARKRKIISDDGTIFSKYERDSILVENYLGNPGIIKRQENGNYDYHDIPIYKEEVKLLKVLIDMDLEKEKEQNEIV